MKATGTWFAAVAVAAILLYAFLVVEFGEIWPELVHVEVGATDAGRIACTSSLHGLTFTHPSSAADCFNTTGCTGRIAFFGPRARVTQVIESLVYYQDTE